MSIEAFFRDFSGLLPLIGGGGALGILEAARRIWLNSRKSKLLRPDAFKLPQIPESTAIYQRDFSEVDHFLVGRDRDTAVLTRILQENPLVFVDGPSGVGKSTLLKLGVARRLMQTGAWLPVYVDIWGMDWVDGPRQALADALQIAVEYGLEQSQRERLGLGSAVTTENIWRILEGLRAVCGRRPVLIFDQIDDYQNRHWQRFKGDDGALISTTTLLERNAFWVEISRLCRSNGVHITFAVRSDAAISLNTLRFQEPKPFRLARLESADVRSLIENLVDEAAVAHPENGFDQLKDRIAEDLQERGSDPGVLPIQMRVAISGLSSLARLTPSHLRKGGGIEGLEAAYVEKHASRTSNGVSTVLRVLLQLVIHSVGDVHKTAFRDLPELISATQLSPNEVRQILESMEVAQIVRRRLDPGRGEVWQLYHDYLARAVVRLDQKDREGEILLAENAKIFAVASGPWDKARALLAPLDQLRLLKDRLHGRLTYRPFGGYALLSLPRLFLNAPVLLVLLSLGGTIYVVRQTHLHQEQERERLADSLLTRAQTALRQHDIANAVEAFGGVIDHLPPSDSRASAALAGLVANIASAPWTLSNIGPVRTAALSVDADKLLVRRINGRVEAFEGTTGRKLPAPDVGLFHNSFEWMNFQRYQIDLSDDGKVASLAYPAKAIDPGDPASRMKMLMAYVVWRPGSDKPIWQETDDRDSISIFHGPHGYVIIQRDESTEILRVGDTGVDTMRLTGGKIAYGFPPTGEPFIVWRTGEPKTGKQWREPWEQRMALVDVDKVPTGYSGPVPKNAILWAHIITDYSGTVRWQGRISEPAFLYTTSASSRYCNASDCKAISTADHKFIHYATAPTSGIRLVDGKEADEKKLSTPWAQGPSPDTSSWVYDGLLRVDDVPSRARQGVRSIGASAVAQGWNRSGSEFWVINGAGDLVSFPIRPPQLSNLISSVKPSTEGGGSTKLSPRHDRSLTINKVEGADEIEITSEWKGVETSTHKTWHKKLAGLTGAWFSVDGAYVVGQSYHEPMRGGAMRKVTVLSAETGVEWANFETHGWRFFGDVWIAEDRQLVWVFRFSDDEKQTSSVCEWSRARLSKCKSIDGHAQISRDGKYFIEGGPYSTALYVSSDLSESQLPVLEVLGTTARQRFDRALLELIVGTADSVHVSKENGAAKVTAQWNGMRITASVTDASGVSVIVGERALRFPENSFEQIEQSSEGLWGPEVRRLELASDGRTMIVCRNQNEQINSTVYSKENCEIWDVVAGVVLGVVPSDDSEASFDYLVPSITVLPEWASEGAMIALIRGQGTGRWRTRNDVLRAIHEEAERGDPVSKRASQSISDAWSR